MMDQQTPRSSLATASPRRYLPLELLGEGWKGQVHRGRPAEGDGDCAILELAPALTTAADFAERFRLTGSMLTRLEHPGLAQTLDFLQQDGQFHVVSRLLRGPKLAQWLAEFRPSPASILEVLCACLDALEYAHGHAVYHLDLTPAQLFVEPPAGACLTDLGLATLLGAAGRAARAKDSQGSRRRWPYAAPESHQEPARADGRADIYSVAVIAYEALTGRLPLGVFDMPSQVAPGLDPRIDPIIATALTADPSRRYQRASELAAALRHVLAASRPAPVPELRSTLAPADGRPRPIEGSGTGELSTLTLDSDPPAARVTDLSGTAYGDTPLVLKLPPGSYTFCFRLPEPYVPITEEVRLIAGSSARVVARPAKRSGEISVVSAPLGAEVSRAGTLLGLTPLVFPVMEGESGELVLSKQGYHETTVHFEGRSAQKHEVRATLKPRMAVLQITTDPVGTDVLDEKQVRISTAPSRVHLEAGKRRLTFRAGRGFDDQSLELDLEPGEERNLELRLLSRPGLVEVTSVPSGAEVFRDGTAIGVTSMALNLPGQEPIELLLKKPGYKDLPLTVTASGGARTVAEGLLELADVPGFEPLGSNGDGFREYRNAADGSVLIFVPGGSFVRGNEHGDPDEKPVRTLTLADYYIGKTPVTNRQYRQFLAATGHRKPALYPGFDGDEQPVVGLDWTDAAAYCAWAGLRLPTEAEWEKAARGLDERSYPWGNQPPLDLLEELQDLVGRRASPRLAAFGLRARATAEIGSFPSGASPYGCLDMCGNVWEWCADWHDPDYYGRAPELDPPGPERGNERICRGGCWSTAVLTFRQVWERLCQAGSHKREAWRFHVPRATVSTRGWFLPSYRFNNLGFRVARSHP
jgi:formylglycine-generating enzyme required for sulfatase activity/serine/threonine protein kinase